MSPIPNLPPEAFTKQDPTPDRLFYAHPRFVTHIDAAAIQAVTTVYRDTIPAGGVILDLMSSWVSHLPDDIAYTNVIGHGLNEAELAANSRLNRHFVQDLNANQILPLDTAAFDAACLCVSVQYLQRPVDIFREVGRVLRPGAPFIVSFSNRCFPTKAVAIWHALSGPDQQRLVAAYMDAAGFDSLETRAHTPPDNDPLWVVIGRRTQTS